MKKSIFFVVTSLALFFAAPNESRAGIVVTTQATVVDAATTATVNVIVSANFDGVAGPGAGATQLVSTYGLSVAVTGVTPTITSSATALNTSDWFAFDIETVTSPTSNSVLFQGRQNSTLVPTVGISAGPAGVAHRLGTFSFTVNKTNALQSFTITPTGAPAINGVLAPPPGGSSGNGFLFLDTGALVSIVPTVFGGATGNIGITAVPEPSSFALLGLVACGYMIRRRRAAKVS